MSATEEILNATVCQTESIQKHIIIYIRDISVPFNTCDPTMYCVMYVQRTKYYNLCVSVTIRVQISSHRRDSDIFRSKRHEIVSTYFFFFVLRVHPHSVELDILYTRQYMDKKRVQVYKLLCKCLLCTCIGLQIIVLHTFFFF